MKNIHEIITKNLASEKEIILQRGKFLKAAGSIDTHIYLVEEGSLKIGIYTEKEDKILRFGYKNDIITALDSFLTGEKSEMYIQAIKKSRLKVISKSVLMEFVQKSVENGQVYTQILEKLLVEQLEREKDLLLSSPKERYERVFKRNPKLFQEIPNRYIANYLNMTEETLSRLKKTRFWSRFIIGFLPNFAPKRNEYQRINTTTSKNNH